MQTVARAVSERGELALLRHRSGRLELRVNGIFVMDSEQASTEIALADEVRRRLGGRGQQTQIVVGGLGLGITLVRLLDDPALDRIMVVEIEQALVDWHRGGLIPATAQRIDDPRISLVVGDVAQVVRGLGDHTVDALVLDVDNGPGHLVYDGNAAVYRTEFLTTCRRVLRADGVLAIWSADPAPDLEGALGDVFGSVAWLAIPVRLGERDESYHLYVAPERPTGR